MQPASVAGRVEVDRHAPAVLAATAPASVAPATTALMYTALDTVSS